MDDLAWVCMRTGYAGMSDPRPLFDRYTSLSGIPVDVASVNYYRALVYARMAACCVIAIQNRARLGTANMEIATHLTLLAALTVALPRTLAALAGVDEAPVDAIGAPNDTDTFVFDVVLADFNSLVVPAVTDQAAATRAAGLSALLEHLRVSSQYRDAVNAAEREDLVALLGSSHEADGELLRRVRTGDPEDDERLLRYFIRSGVRHSALWPTSQAMAAMLPAAFTMGPAAATAP
jgi:hypothetical protein